MFHDSMAMKGFGKMFKSFWKTQIESADKLRKFIILRGGIFKTEDCTVSE